MEKYGRARRKKVERECQKINGKTVKREREKDRQEERNKKAVDDQQ